VEQQLNLERSVYEHSQVSQEVAIEKRLREKKFPGLSSLEWTQLLAKAKHHKAVMQLEKFWMEKIEASRKAEINVIETELSQRLDELDSINRKMASLTIKARHNGFVQNLPVEEGLVVEAGTPLVKMTSIDDFYVQLKISQDQIADVEIGQKATISTRHGKLSGAVRHVHGTVNQGAVLVDIELTEDLPKGAKDGQRVDGSIITDHLSSTVFVNRPATIQANQSGWIFRLNRDGNKAERIKVNFGKTGLHKIEVISGLAAGERIIVSELGRWKTEESIVIH
jgi:HlyD family secretion protein